MESSLEDWFLLPEKYFLVSETIAPLREEPHFKKRDDLNKKMGLYDNKEEHTLKEITGLKCEFGYNLYLDEKKIPYMTANILGEKEQSVPDVLTLNPEQRIDVKGFEGEYKKLLLVNKYQHDHHKKKIDYYAFVHLIGNKYRITHHKFESVSKWKLRMIKKDICYSLETIHSKWTYRVN